MRWYGMTDLQVLEMPVRRFWLLHKSIDRMAAEEDLRAIQVGTAVTSPEGYRTTVTALRKQMGQVAIYDEAKRSLSRPRDVAGLMRLKDMGRLGQ